MTSGSKFVEPRRLVHEDDCVGQLLRAADTAFSAGLPQVRSVLAIRPPRRASFGLLGIGAAASLAALLLVAAAWRVPGSRTDTGLITLTAEPIARPAALAPGLPVAMERRISPPASAPLTAVVAHPPSSALPSRLSDASCRSFDDRHEYGRAVDCFATIGRGSDLPADVALYEAARLSAEQLQDPRRALALLDEHALRFPGSALRGEVNWLRARSLQRVGRVSEALQVSEALLASPEGQALAGKLHLLRGNLYARAQKDCAKAVPEYVALLGEPGPEGDEAEFQRAECLEQIASPSEARAAYDQYLARADARNSARARARLLALSSSEPAAKGEH